MRIGEAALRRRFFSAVRHLAQLPSPGQPRSQRPGLRIRKRSWVGAHNLGELREHLSIEGIDFGQVPTGFGEVAHLTRIDDPR